MRPTGSLLSLDWSANISEVSYLCNSGNEQWACPSLFARIHFTLSIPTKLRHLLNSRMRPLRPTSTCQQVSRPGNPNSTHEDNDENELPSETLSTI